MPADWPTKREAGINGRDVIDGTRVPGAVLRVRFAGHDFAFTVHPDEVDRVPPDSVESIAWDLARDLIESARIEMAEVPDAG